MFASPMRRGKQFKKRDEKLKTLGVKEYINLACLPHRDPLSKSVNSKMVRPSIPISKDQIIPQGSIDEMDFASIDSEDLKNRRTQKARERKSRVPSVPRPIAPIIQTKPKPKEPVKKPPPKPIPKKQSPIVLKVEKKMPDPRRGSMLDNFLFKEVKEQYVPAPESVIIEEVIYSKPPPRKISLVSVEVPTNEKQKPILGRSGVLDRFKKKNQSPNSQYLDYQPQNSIASLNFNSKIKPEIRSSAGKNSILDTFTGPNVREFDIITTPDLEERRSYSPLAYVNVNKGPNSDGYKSGINNLELKIDDLKRKQQAEQLNQQLANESKINGMRREMNGKFEDVLDMLNRMKNESKRNKMDSNQDHLNEQERIRRKNESKFKDIEELLKDLTNMNKEALNAKQKEEKLAPILLQKQIERDQNMYSSLKDEIEKLLKDNAKLREDRSKLVSNAKLKNQLTQNQLDNLKNANERLLSDNRNLNNDLKKDSPTSKIYQKKNNDLMKQLDNLQKQLDEKNYISFNSNQKESSQLNDKDTCNFLEDILGLMSDYLDIELNPTRSKDSFDGILRKIKRESNKSFDNREPIPLRTKLELKNEIMQLLKKLQNQKMEEIRQRNSRSQSPSNQIQRSGRGAVNEWRPGMSTSPSPKRNYGQGKPRKSSPHYPNSPSRAPALHADLSPRRRSERMSFEPSNTKESYSRASPSHKDRSDFQYNLQSGTKKKPTYSQTLKSRSRQSPHNSRYNYHQIPKDERDRSPIVQSNMNQNPQNSGSGSYTGPPTRLYKNNNYEIPTKDYSPSKEMSRNYSPSSKKLPIQPKNKRKYQRSAIPKNRRSPSPTITRTIHKDSEPRGAIITPLAKFIDEDDDDESAVNISFDIKANPSKRGGFSNKKDPFDVEVILRDNKGNSNVKMETSAKKNNKYSNQRPNNSQVPSFSRESTPLQSSRTDRRLKTPQRYRDTDGYMVEEKYEDVNGTPTRVLYKTKTSKSRLLA